ncbi:ATP-binding cassette domain-containing protein [Cytophagales bacterium RKSG123]|nr:ABC transporter ATP-binding protein [Xanthovirga aplysinae]MTI32828.1 ATP-binding cassette domain-containing protein [Xanthovirga aplysinae]
MIEFKEVSLSREGKTIINKYSFSIKKGEKVCLWGPSGSGKTTILRILMGMLEPDSGTVKYENLLLSPENMPLIRKKIAWVPQNINLPVNSGLELAKMLQKDTYFKQNIEPFLEKTGMSTDMLTKDFSEISGGQKQRLVLATCLALKRPILFLDEPTSALDNLSIKQLMDAIFSMKDLTVISATHNEQWMKQCDKVINL